MKGLFSIHEKNSVEWDEDLLDWFGATVEVYDVRNDKNGYPHFLICEDGEWKYKSAKHFTNKLPDNLNRDMECFKTELYIIISNNEEDDGRYYDGEGCMTNNIEDAKFYATEDLAYTELSKFDEYRKYEVRKVVTHLNILSKQK